MDEYELKQDVQDLKQKWINEVCCADILKFETDLVERIREQLKHQEQKINEVKIENSNEAFIVNLYEIDLERVKYILKAYLKTRLQKIEENFMYIENSDAKTLLCDAEQTYAAQYFNLVHKHFDDSFLSHLPDKINTMSEEATSEPELNNYTFCRVLQDLGDCEIDDQNSVELNKGDIVGLRYVSIQSFLEKGEVELL